MDNSARLPKAAVISAANGMMFMTFFGALWGFIGIIGSHGIANPWLLVFCSIVTVVLACGSLVLFGKGRHLTNNVTSEDRAHWKNVNKKFILVFALEGIAIAIASVICNMTDRFELFFPIMAIIVGVHFFPLAQLFRVYFYHVTGAVLCALGIIAFFIPLNATIAGVALIARSMFIGLSSAVTLWATGISIWIMTWRQLKSS